MNGTAALIAVLQVLIVILGVGGGWWLLNAVTAFDDHDELWERANWGYLVQRVGFVAVQVIGVSSLIGQDLTNWNSLAWVGGGIVWATLLAVLGFWITDWMILRSRATPLGGLNTVPLSVGLVRLGFYLGLALVVRATFVGQAPNLRTSLISTLVFTVAGIAGLVIAFYLHGLVAHDVEWAGITQPMVFTTGEYPLGIAVPQGHVVPFLGSLARPLCGRGPGHRLRPCARRG